MKKFLIIIRSIKDKQLEHSIYYTREHEIDEINTVDYLCERFYEEAVDEYDLYDSDDVSVYEILEVSFKN